MNKIDTNTVKQFFEESGANIYDTASRTVKELDMWDIIDKGVLIGLSGGADSVMLLMFLLEYRRREGLNFPILCSHVNHGIRGEEADRDESFCRDLCRALDVELIVSKYDVPTLANSLGTGVEETARNVRYSCFRDIICGRNDISCIAVAHNMSDSAETVLFNILRGSGAKGASGIRPVRDNIVRPLIKIAKKDIISAIEKYGISYVTDSTNSNVEYTRNYIRNKIIPALSDITPDPERMICRFADNMRSDEDYLSSVAVDFLRNRSSISSNDLLGLHYSLFVRVLALMAEEQGALISNKIADDIHSLLLKDNFSYSVIGGASFVCERGICRVFRDATKENDFRFLIKKGLTELSPFNASFLFLNEKIDKNTLNVYKIAIQADISSAIIVGDLYLRPKKDGDSVFYGGMTHKLKKLFSDAKIPKSKRSLIPILCDDKGVVWVPGFGVRDDGIKMETGEKNYVAFGIKDESDGKQRLYSASEFRT